MKLSRKKTIWAIMFIIILVFLIGSYVINKNDTVTTPIQKTAFKLNTMVTITLYDSNDESIIDNAFKICDYYEKIYSRTLDSSELYILNDNNKRKTNENNTYRVSDELKDLLEYGLYYSKLSEGGFDITIEPVSSLWGFTSDPKVIPHAKEISSNLPFVGFNKLTLNENEVSFQEEGMGIDLGAIAKGYIADRIKDYLLSKGINSAMINLGGNVLCVGDKPGDIPFKIGIQKPFADKNELVAMMEIRDMSIVSSGIYERFIETEDEFYHHILNPKTGYSYENDLISVTILSKYSVDGDGLSTTTFALGLDKGMELINSIPDTYAVFVTDDYELHYSDGFLENIKVTEIEE